MLLQEIIDAVAESRKSDLLKVVGQGNAERVHAKAKGVRRRQIDTYSQSTFDTLLEHHVEDVARLVLLEELRNRSLARSSIRHWRTWTQRLHRARDHAAKERDETCMRLQHLGLSGDTVVPMGAATAEQVDGSQKHHRLDEIEIDVGLQQVGRYF